MQSTQTLRTVHNDMYVSANSEVFLAMQSRLGVVALISTCHTTERKKVLYLFGERLQGRALIQRTTNGAEELRAAAVASEVQTQLFLHKGQLFLPQRRPGAT